MKYNHFLIIAVLATLASLSCNKDKAISPDPHSVTKIQSETSYHADGTISDATSYEYDNDARLLKLKSLDNSYSTADYSTTMIIITYYNADGTLDANQTEQINLDSKGLATSIIYTSTKKSAALNKPHLFKYSTNGNTTYSTTYNTDGFILTRTIATPDYTNIVNHTITNDNVTKEDEVYTPKGGTSSTYSFAYEYYTDKINTIGMYNTGIYYNGKDNKNLYKKKTVISGSTSYILNNYEYEFDGKGRVSKIINKDASGTISGWTTYVYND